MFDLNGIKDPSFVKDLNKKELKTLAAEVREFIIKSLSKTGGHLASNLGVVELTIGLYYVFNQPNDRLIFDVGHQCYTHKILTGRANEFDKLRKFDGLSGYIKRNESTYDVFEAGHSSTSISALAGFLQAKKEGAPLGDVVALIGDAALMNGLAFEALNYLGSKDNMKSIIILNDNKMAISKSVGSMSRLLNRIRGSKFEVNLKKVVYRIAPEFLISGYRKIARGIKGLVQNDNIFEDLGFQYMGPVDGNDINSVIKILKKAKSNKTSCIVHILTEKGCGYKIASEDLNGDYHGVPPFDIATGLPIKKSDTTKVSWSEVISEVVIDLENKMNIDVVIPAMINGSKFNRFNELYPNKLFDVGIAEEHAATMAAAMALNGLNVFLPMYSTFAQRAYDEINHDICRQNAHVVIGIDRAGIVGEDGDTHQGIFDIAFLAHIPNIVITMPSTPIEAYSLLDYGFSMQSNPFVIRYPRGSVTFSKDSIIKEKMKEKWPIIKEGKAITIISYGPNVVLIKKLCEDNNIDATICNAMFIKPIEEKTLLELANRKAPILVYEEVSKIGSLGMMILEKLNEKNINRKIHLMSLDDSYITHGEISKVKHAIKMDEEAILKKIKEIICD